MNIQKELEKDGVSGALYHLLWIKNEAFSEKLQLNIPDTVIYFNGKPIFWYYSTSEGLKKRKKEKVANSNILAYFQKIDPGIGVSAVFLHNEQQKSGQKKIICRYMDLKQLGEFLEDENKPKEGILQRFVLPFGLNNCKVYFDLKMI